MLVEAFLRACTLVEFAFVRRPMRICLHRVSVAYVVFNIYCIDCNTVKNGGYESDFVS